MLNHKEVFYFAESESITHIDNLSLLPVILDWVKLYIWFVMNHFTRKRNTDNSTLSLHGCVA